MKNLEFNRIEFEELEDRFEMAAAGGGKCERKCSGGDGGDGGDGGGNGGNGPVVETPSLPTDSIAK